MLQDRAVDRADLVQALVAKFHGVLKLLRHCGDHSVDPPEKLDHEPEAAILCQTCIGMAMHGCVRHGLVGCS